jgi:hypothetical protein
MKFEFEALKRQPYSTGFDTKSFVAEAAEAAEAFAELTVWLKKQRVAPTLSKVVVVVDDDEEHEDTLAIVRQLAAPTATADVLSWGLLEQPPKVEIRHDTLIGQISRERSRDIQALIGFLSEDPDLAYERFPQFSRAQVREMYIAEAAKRGL